MLLSALFVTISFAGASLQAVVPKTRETRATDNHLFGPLTFSDDGTFQISIFEDLHFGENAWDCWGPLQDVFSVKVMNEILDKESPDLVVLNGDLITGENTFLQNSTHYVDEIVGPLVQRGLTWASTYGNHDSAYNLSREDILEREHLWPNARTTQMVFGKDSGVSNYYLPVYPANSLGLGAPEVILWFFDSRGGNYFQELDAPGNEVPQPNWVDISVVDWFTETNALLTLTHGKAIPSVVFVHIPTNASQAAQMEIGINPNQEPGINDDILLGQQSQGWCADGSSNASCSYGGQDGPFMRALTETPGVIGVFSGHDHGDSWCYKWDSLLPGMSVKGSGFNLCFGQHSGYGGYGTWIRGSRQILLTQSQLRDLTAESWIRRESGDVVGSVSLNATYGRDHYPATPDDMTNLPSC